MLKSNLADILAQTVDAVTHAGELLIAVWGRVGGPRGEGNRAEVDMEIEAVLRSQLLGLLCCDFWGGGDRAEQPLARWVMRASLRRRQLHA